MFRLFASQCDGRTVVRLLCLSVLQVSGTALSSPPSSIPALSLSLVKSLAARRTVQDRVVWSARRAPTGVLTEIAKV